MANMTGYEETGNPGWINVKFDDGSNMHVEDPTGMFRGQITEVASKLAPTPVPMPQLGGEAQGMMPQVDGPTEGAQRFYAPPQPAANPIFTPPSPAPVATPTPAAPAPAPAVPAAPVPSAPIAAAPVVAGVSPSAPIAPMKAAPGMRMSGQRRSMTGIAGEDKQVIDAANADAMGAREEADDAAIEARTNQLQAEWDRLTGDEKSKLAEQQVLKDKETRFTAKLDAQMKRNQEITDRPIDGAKAFDGDAGFYAFMAAMGEAVSDFGRALLGQPARGNPAEVIDRIMQNSINSQTELKREQLQQGRLTVEQFDAEREKIRLGITTVGKQLAETQLGKATTEQERLGLGALQKKFTAEQKDAIAKNAMATARQETREEQFERPKPVGVAGVTAADLVKEMLAKRDLAQLDRSNLTEEEYAKQAAEYAEKATKQRDYVGAVESLVSNIKGLEIETLPDGRKIVSGEPKLMDDSGFDLTVDPAEAAENNRAIDRGYTALQRSDVMSMLREPSANLQDSFKAIKGQLQFHLDMARQAEKDIAAGKNPIVIKDYNSATQRDGSKPKPGSVPTAWK
jgi:hypothetical protein